jgi:hypothetical protein
MLHVINRDGQHIDRQALPLAYDTAAAIWLG